MKGVIKIVVLIVIALANSAGYVVLLSVTSGLKPAQAFLFLAPIKMASKTQTQDVMPPAKTAQKPDSISDSFSAEATNEMSCAGFAPVVLTGPNIRLGFKRLIAAALPPVAFISFNELIPNIEAEVIKTVRIANEN